ncbi:hypothetical protein JOB18_030513, partial [Solea senegalensis]
MDAYGRDDDDGDGEWILVRSGRGRRRDTGGLSQPRYDSSYPRRFPTQRRSYASVTRGDSFIDGRFNTGPRYTQQPMANIASRVPSRTRQQWNNGEQRRDCQFYRTPPQ